MYPHDISMTKPNKNTGTKPVPKPKVKPHMLIPPRKPIGNISNSPTKRERNANNKDLGLNKQYIINFKPE